MKGLAHVSISYLFLLQLPELDLREEWMRDDITYVIFRDTQPVLRVPLQKKCD